MSRWFGPNLDRCVIVYLTKKPWGGRTAKDVSKRGFVFHLERFKPKNAKYASRKTGKCRYGTTERDMI
jgi:hypothetical protein